MITGAEHFPFETSRTETETAPRLEIFTQTNESSLSFSHGAPGEGYATFGRGERRLHEVILVIDFLSLTNVEL